MHLSSSSPEHPLHMHCGCSLCKRCMCPSKTAGEIEFNPPVPLTVPCHTACHRARKPHLLYLTDPLAKHLNAQSLNDLLAGSCLSLNLKSA